MQEVQKEQPINMQQFWVFVRKEFYHIFRDKKSLLIIFALPIAQMLIFGFALTNEIKNTQIGILDNANDEASLNLIAQLEASKYLKQIKLNWLL